MTTSPAPINGWYLYGDKGMLVGRGIFSLAVCQQEATAESELLPVPQHLVDALPQVGDDVQNKWVALAQDFVADIRDEPHQRYLTFKDGWRYQETIDAIRSGRGWCDVSGPS